MVATSLEKEGGRRTEEEGREDNSVTPSSALLFLRLPPHRFSFTKARNNGSFNKQLDWRAWETRTLRKNAINWFAVEHYVLVNLSGKTSEEVSLGGGERREATDALLPLPLQPCKA